MVEEIMDKPELATFTIKTPTMLPNKARETFHVAKVKIKISLGASRR
jgi:hypothetical protein